MKIRSLLTIVAMLSMLLCGIGTAHAVLGVADDVPANAVVIPIMCGVDASHGLNTAFALAHAGFDSDKECSTLVEPIITTPDGNAVIVAHASVRNSCSKEVLTFNKPLTCHDVESLNCKDIIDSMSPTQKDQMRISVEGQDWYAGYVIFTNTETSGNDLVSWAYLEDLNLGFVSGLNGIGLEDGAGARMEEDAGAAPITAHDFMPRYFLLNDKAQTWNWWIIMAGRNQIGKVTCDVEYVNCSGALFSRKLTGIICNEQEVCPDFEIGIPRELNIIDVGQHLPVIHTGFPKGGFAQLGIVESGDIGGVSHIITGTTDVTVCTLTTGQYYSIFGWAYQREAADTSELSWDVIHPMHRDYCSVPETLTYITGPACGLDL
ncbi:MAG: hypothetical protein WC769_00930 [Thermodesulfovibrionales bacterium]